MLLPPADIKYWRNNKILQQQRPLSLFLKSHTSNELKHQCRRDIRNELEKTITDNTTTSRNEKKTRILIKIWTTQKWKKTTQEICWQIFRNSVYSLLTKIRNRFFFSFLFCGGKLFPWRSHRSKASWAYNHDTTASDCRNVAGSVTRWSSLWS